MTGVAIGLGCRGGVNATAIVACVREVLAKAALPADGATIFTIDAKLGEHGLVKAAEGLGLPLRFLSRETLRKVLTPTQSPYSLAAFGVGSIAESAALAGAGDGATLVAARFVRDGVTCALACVRSTEIP